MRYWESSAIVPLVVNEPATVAVASLYASDPGLLVGCLTPVEVWSAVCRKRREVVLGSPAMRDARARLDRLAGDWTEVDDVGAIRKRARRLLEVHPLRTSDAVQLATALVGVADRPEGFPFVTLDVRLGEAAEKEGFEVLGVVPP